MLISEYKGLIAQSLRLDVYIDDNYDNVRSVALCSPLTRNYLLDRAYNRLGEPDGVVRVGTVGEMFTAELDRL